MAKTTNPLFSFAATGTLAGALAFRQTAGRNIAQRTPQTIPRPSTTQSAERALWADAAAIWRTLDAETRTEWLELAAQRGKPSFAVFAGEYRLQQIVPPALPLVPAQ